MMMDGVSPVHRVTHPKTFPRMRRRPWNGRPEFSVVNFRRSVLMSQMMKLHPT